MGWEDKVSGRVMRGNNNLEGDGGLGCRGDRRCCRGMSEMRVCRNEGVGTEQEFVRLTRVRAGNKNSANKNERLGSRDTRVLGRRGWTGEEKVSQVHLNSARLQLITWPVTRWLNFSHLSSACFCSRLWPSHLKAQH